MPDFKVTYTLDTIPVENAEWARMISELGAAAEPEAVAKLVIAANAPPSPWTASTSSQSTEGHAYNTGKTGVQAALSPWTVKPTPIDTVLWLPSGDRHIIITPVMDGADIAKKQYEILIEDEVYELTAKLYVRGVVEEE